MQPVKMFKLLKVPCVLTRRSLEDWREYLAREQRNLKRMQKLIACEICYERPLSTEESHGFACRRHRLCEECWRRCLSCPLCRASKIGVYGDLWIPCYPYGEREWNQLTNDMLTRGINPSFSYSKLRKNLPNIFKWCVELMNGPLAAIFSPKQLIGTAAKGLNKFINFPIFAWKEQRHLEYDYERYEKIELRLTQILGLEGAKASAFGVELRMGLAKVIRKIKEVSRTHNIPF
jgi:hypothetical protein